MKKAPRDKGAEGPRAEPAVGRAFYAVAELATLLGLGERTVRRMLARRALPHYRVGGLIRIRIRDVERYLEGVRQLDEEGAGG